MISKGEEETIRRIREWISKELGSAWKCLSIARYERTSYGSGIWGAIVTDGTHTRIDLFTYDSHGALCWNQPIYRQEL